MFAQVVFTDCVCGLVAQVGGKSKGLAALEASLPPGINVPSSVALPFGAFRKALSSDGSASGKYEGAVQALGSASGAPGLPAAQLASIRAAIAEMQAPPGNHALDPISASSPLCLKKSS
jgi:hypothetical protein